MTEHKRGIESFFTAEVQSISSDESSNDSESENTERPQKKQKKAQPNPEPSPELRTEIEGIVAEVDRWRAELTKKRQDIIEMEKQTAGMSFDDLTIVKDKYTKSIKNSNKQKEKAFKEFEMAWKGICPGCSECMGEGSPLKRKHAIESMNIDSEATMIGIFSREVMLLNQRLLAENSGAIGQWEEKEDRTSDAQVEGTGPL